MQGKICKGANTKKDDVSMQCLAIPNTSHCKALATIHIADDDDDARPEALYSAHMLLTSADKGFVKKKHQQLHKICSKVRTTEVNSTLCNTNWERK